MLPGFFGEIPTRALRLQLRPPLNPRMGTRRELPPCRLDVHHLCGYPVSWWGLRSVPMLAHLVGSLPLRYESRLGSSNLSRIPLPFGRASRRGRSPVSSIIRLCSRQLHPQGRSTWYIRSSPARCPRPVTLSPLWMKSARHVSFSPAARPTRV